MARSTWPETIYNYERGAIVDDELVELDLDGGAWLRCRCCDRVILAKGAFYAGAWKRHKKTLAHCHAKKTSTKRAVEKTPQYRDVATAAMESVENDTDYSALFQNELDRCTKEQAQTKMLACDMALLVADQQDDILALQAEVDELRDVVDELREMLHVLQEANRGVGRGHKKRRLRNETEFSAVQRRPPLFHRKHDSRMEVINMFEDEVQLTQSD